MNFSQRNEMAKQLNASTIRAKTPMCTRKHKPEMYTPSQDKLDGYSQFPRPVALPYSNII
jgi:hypothetical protein